MPRYFFDVLDQGSTHLDHSGTTFSNYVEARQEASRLLYDMAHDYGALAAAEIDITVAVRCAAQEPFCRIRMQVTFEQLA